MENERKIFVKRLLMTVFGVVICGMAVALFKTSRFGVDPFQTFANGLSEAVKFTGLSFGTVYVILNVVFLVAIFLLDKHYIGIATVINLFGIGYISDFTQEYIIYKIVPEPDVAARVILLLLGILIICVASSLYFTADLGVSTYDAISLIMADKKIAKFQYCRIGCDVLCVIIGVILCVVGGANVFDYVNVGTIITAFFMGPLIAFFNKHIAIPMLYGKEGKPE